MSEKEQKAQARELNENVLKEFIEEHMDKSYEEIDSYEILKRRPHEKISRDDRIAIAKRIQDKLDEDGELDELHFKAAITAGLVVEDLEP